MSDRRSILDAVCAGCKRVIRREYPESDDVIQAKAEIAADGLVPFGYETDRLDLKPVQEHAGNCPKRPH